MLNVKVTSFLFLIFGLYSTAVVECKEFNAKEAQKLVITVFNTMKPMFHGDENLGLDNCDSEIQGATTPDDLDDVVENLLTEDHMYGLRNMNVDSRNDLISKINTFTPAYQKLLTESGNANKPVPFKDLLQELNAANEKKDQ